MITIRFDRSLQYHKLTLIDCFKTIQRLKIPRLAAFDTYSNFFIDSNFEQHFLLLKSYNKIIIQIVTQYTIHQNIRFVKNIKDVYIEV